jgi:hypothetical protein
LITTKKLFTTTEKPLITTKKPLSEAKKSFLSTEKWFFSGRKPFRQSTKLCILAFSACNWGSKIKEATEVGAAAFFEQQYTDNLTLTILNI